MTRLILMVLLVICNSYALDLENEVKTMKETIDSLKGDLRSLEEENKWMKENFTVEISQLKDKCKVVLSEPTKNRDIKKLNYPIDPAIVADGDTFAFHASISGNLAVHDNEKIVFDKVTTNLGDGYNDVSGIFRVPKAGYYVFFVNLLVLPHKINEAVLMKNAATILNIYSGSADSAFGPGSNMIVVQLAEGDDIFVKVHEKWHGTGDILDGAWCTFSGFLLY